MSVSLRQRELATQAANETYSSVQRIALNREAEELTREYQRLIESTVFNGLPLFNGGSVSIQAGSGNEAAFSIDPISFGAGGSSTYTVPVTTLSQPDGTFAAASAFSLIDGNDIASADVNGDGNMDLIVGSWNTNRVVIYQGDGSGSFSPSLTFLMPDRVYRVDVTDVNGDGKADLAASLYNGDVHMLLNQGDGTFGAATNYYMGGGMVIKFADINGDSKLDLVSSTGNDEGTCTPSYRLGNGVGGFSPSITYFLSVEGFVREITAGDIDGDGDTDLAFLGDRDTLYGVPATITILSNNGSGTFSKLADYTLGSVDVSSMVLTDLNGDSKLDLAFTGGTNIQARLGNGSGSFAASTTVNLGAYVGGLVTGDVDGDGDLDIIGTSSTQHSILLNSGAGSFSLARSYNVGGTDNNILLADLNNDGFSDILSNNTTTFRLQLGQGSLTEVTTTITVQTGGGAAGSLDLTTVDGAKDAMDQLDDRILNLSSKLDAIGATTSRLSAGLDAIKATHEAYLNASARIRSIDVAEEAAASVRLQLLQSTGAAILAQANQQPQLALMLLG